MMRLLLLHGPGIINSRNQLIIIKKQFNEDSISVWEDKFNFSELINHLMTPALFSDKRLVILEKPSEEYNYTQLPKIADLTLVLWFDKELGVKSKILSYVKASMGEVKVFSEKQEATIFPFLDSLGNQDKKAFIELAKLKTQGIDTHYLITLIYYLLRNLVCIPQNAPSFVQKKMESQKANFKLEELINIYNNILNVDYKLKAGLIEKDQAEFYIINQFLKPKIIA